MDAARQDENNDEYDDKDVYYYNNSSNMNASPDVNVNEVEVCMQNENNFMLQELSQTKTSKCMRELIKFLDSRPEFQAKKGSPDTNIQNPATGKCYKISDAHIAEFFKHVETCRRQSNIMHFQERQTEYSGVMIDFDRYQKSEIREMNDWHFVEVAKLLCQIFANTLQIFDEKGIAQFKIFIIQKPSPVLETQKESKKGLYKDGVHFLIPEIQIRREAKRYILDKLATHPQFEELFEDIPNLEPPKSMVDMMSACVPINFYGCSKFRSIPYILTYVLDCHISRGGKSINVSQMADAIEALNFHRTEHKSGGANKRAPEDPPPTFIDKAAGGKRIDPAEYNLVYELSLSFSTGIEKKWLNKRRVDIRDSCAAEIRIFNERTKDDKLPADELFAVDHSVSVLALDDPEAAYLKRILGILDVSYATEYHKWFGVICAIANTSHMYKELAQWFSQRNPTAWNPVEFERVWREAVAGNCRGDPVTKLSIIHWARECDPQMFKMIQQNSYDYVLESYARKYEGKIGHAMVARILNIMLFDKYIVDTNDKNEHGWYEFVSANQSQEHGQVWKWRFESKRPDVLHRYISEHLPKVYEVVEEKLRKTRDDNAHNEDLVKYWGKVEKEFKNSMFKLSDNTYQNNILSQAIYWFRRRGFSKQLDKDVDIIGVANGVLKLGMQARLITGPHEYKVSKYMTADYQQYDPADPIIRRIEAMIHEMFPEEDVFQFILMYLSMALEGNIARPMIVFLVGGGCNGKSILFSLLGYTFGELYWYKCPITILTSAYEKANEANSALASMEGKRLHTFSESNEGMKLNEGRVKDLTGGESISGRDLFKGQRNFEIRGVLICGSNHEIKITSTDHGIWRRIFYYKCKVKFTQTPMQGNQYEKQADPSLPEKIKTPEWRRAMLSILVHYNIKLRKEYHHNINAVPCSTIKYETEVFRNSQDVFNRFITERMVKTTQAEKDITVEMLHAKYSEWYFSNFRRECDLNVDNVMTRLENSQLHGYLSRLDNGACVLKGMRIADRSDETLETFEAWFFPANTLHTAGIHADDIVDSDDINTKHFTSPATSPVIYPSTPPDTLQITPIVNIITGNIGGDTDNSAENIPDEPEHDGADDNNEDQAADEPENTPDDQPDDDIDENNADEADNDNASKEVLGGHTTDDPAEINVKSSDKCDQF